MANGIPVYVYVYDREFKRDVIDRMNGETISKNRTTGDRYYIATVDEINQYGYHIKVKYKIQESINGNIVSKSKIN